MRTWKGTKKELAKLSSIATAFREWEDGVKYLTTPESDPVVKLVSRKLSPEAERSLDSITWIVTHTVMAWIPILVKEYTEKEEVVS